MDETSAEFDWQLVVAIGGVILFGLALLFVLRSRPSATARVNSRSDNRYQSKFKGWMDFNGQRCSIRGIDMNDSGALVASKIHVAPESAVFVYIASHGLMGWAKVKHCSPHGANRYRIGLKFRGALMRAHDGNWEFASARPAK